MSENARQNAGSPPAKLDPPHSLADVAPGMEEMWETIARQARIIDQLRFLVDATKVLNSTLDLDELLNIILGLATRNTHADRGSVFLVDHMRQEIWTVIAQGLEQQEIRLPIGRGIAGSVAQTSKVINLADAYKDPRFDRSFDQRFGYRTRSLLCLPIQDHAGKIIGVLQLLNKQNGSFTGDDVEFLERLSVHCAIALENARLHRESMERQQMERELSRTREIQQLQAAQLELVKADKERTVGRLAAGVAHEVKNPLMTILIGVEYLSEHLATADDNVAALLRDMNDAVKRADSVIRGLLELSAPTQLNLELEDVNTVLEQSLLLVKHELDRSGTTVVRNLGMNLPRVRLDRDKIHQVFINLFMNAIDAMPDGGTLTVSTYRKRLRQVGRHVGRRKADAFRVGETAVVIEVDDTGVGIPEDKLPKLFEPFVTTKPTGKGTGLGLTVTRQIVEMHGGTIDIGNRRNGGVRVRMMLKT